jgi:hypothetical protein
LANSVRKFGSLQVYSEDIFIWRQMDGNGCQLFETLPTIAQVQAAQKVIILDATLESSRYQRRRLIDQLTFVAPEDLCLDLIERARGETSLAEAIAILIIQRDTLMWETLLDQAEQRNLAQHLGVILEAINVEAKTELIPQKIIVKLYNRIDQRSLSAQRIIYPPGRHRSVSPAYQSLSEQWGIFLALPSHVISKVLFDLHLQPQWS